MSWKDAYTSDKITVYCIREDKNPQHIFSDSNGEYHTGVEEEEKPNPLFTAAQHRKAIEDKRDKLEAQLARFLEEEKSIETLRAFVQRLKE